MANHVKLPSTSVTIDRELTERTANGESLEIEEMLAEVRLKDKHIQQMDKWLQEFESLVMSLSSGQSHDLTDQLWCRVAKVPIIQEPFHTAGVFQFLAPKKCHLIGSYKLGTALRRPSYPTRVDMAIEMPTKCWQRQDTLNHRYYRKRALYLCHICQHIQSSSLVAEMKFTYFNGNHMRPVILIAPNGSIGKHFRLSLTALPELGDQKVFRWIRFTPDKNNVRSNWSRIGGTGVDDNDSDGDDQELPTPTYNAGIQHDLNLMANYEFVVQTVTQWPHLKKCLILLKIWLKQRQLTAEFGFCLSLYVCHLLKNRKLNANSSYYQLFRNTLLAISTSKWDTEGVSLNDEIYQSMDWYLSYFPIVFIDVSGYHNICYDITIDTYDRLRHEAKLTIDCLDSNDANSFEVTFLKEITFETKFDIIFKISIPPLLESPKVSQIAADIADNCGDIVTALVGHLVPLCRRTVGQRVQLLQHKSKVYTDHEWPLDQLPRHPNDVSFLMFGILLNEEFAYNTIERGPPADTPEAKDFKDFWGKKSELRRFQDNSICEAVYWDSKTLSQKRQIVTKALEFILTNILEIPEESFSTTIALMDPMVQLSQLKFDDKSVIYGTGEEFSIGLSHKMDALAKKLRSVEGLPLTVTNVQSIDPVFRATDVFPPFAMNSGKSLKAIYNNNSFDPLIDQRVPKYFRPLKVIIQLEGSGKWPDALDAFRRVKASFYIELSRQMAKQFGLISYANTDYVDVFDEGFVFRIIIGSHKELVLLRQITTSDGLVKRVDSEVANDLETLFDVMPKINSSLNALSRRHLCYGITSRLAKRWISSQMLSHYMDDFAVDLITAHLFLSPNPYTVPNSPVIGFIRFLSLICDHNWKISPLIVDLNSDLDEQIVTDIIAMFIKNRSKYPPMFVTSGYDKQLSKWTNRWPDSVILNRMQVLAKAAKQTLISQIKDNITFDPKVIFRPDLEIFDLIIRLKSDQIINNIQAVDFPQTKYEFKVDKFDPKVADRLPIVDFNPVDMFVRQLQTVYADFALFFYDRFGGREIGVLWRPSVFENRPLDGPSAAKCTRLAGTAAANGVQNVVTDIEAIIEDFRILGDGIVRDIDVKTHNMAKHL